MEPPRTPRHLTMASDDTPRDGERPSGIAYSTERELQTLLSGQIGVLRDSLTRVKRADDLDEAERELRELGESALFLADVVEAVDEQEG